MLIASHVHVALSEPTIIHFKCSMYKAIVECSQYQLRRLGWENDLQNK